MKLCKMPDGKPEVYYALQGEGKTQGLPVIFVRLSGCSMFCKFCDSFYSWYFEGNNSPHDFAKPVNKNEYMITLSPSELVKYIMEIVDKSKIRNVVFTGGEPLLQQEELIKVCDLLISDGETWHFEIETAGILKLKPALAIHINQINCSPKLQSSGNPENVRNKPEVIQQLYDYRSIERGLCFKFVIKYDNYENDIKEVIEWQKSYNIEDKYIYLMPEGIEREMIIKTTKLLEEKAPKGYIINTRLHILLNGNKRAV